MKKLLFIFLLSPFFTRAQNKPLIAEGVSPALFITHKVVAIENFYSIGRIYNASPRDIAPFNNLKLESGLNPGQVLRIPLNAGNYFQSGVADDDESFVPLYHIVHSKEGLYRIAVNYNDLPLEKLKQWNNIKTDAVKKGTKLIVGYLKVKKDLSVLAKSGVEKIKDPEEGVAARSEEKKTAEPVVKAAVESSTTKTSKAEPEKRGSAKPASAEIAPVKPDKQSAKESTAAVKNNKGKNIIGGLFKDVYDTQVINSEIAESEGTAGIFKSTSGWSDKKYYCLHNTATQGTIVKITNPDNGKFVFAKVLDLMPDIKQNDGLLICISNAAAEVLGATEGNFNCLIMYSK